MADFPFGILFPIVIILIRMAMTASQHPAGPPLAGANPLSKNPIIDLPEELGEWQSRLVRLPTGGSGGPTVYAIQVRGRFPIQEACEFVVAASIFDVLGQQRGEDPVLAPVLSTMPEFCEPESGAYHGEARFGVVKPKSGFRLWESVIEFAPAALVPPDQGARKFRVLVVGFDDKARPQFLRGFVTGDVPWAVSHDFNGVFDGDGWREGEIAYCLASAKIIEFTLAACGPDPEDRVRPVITRWIEWRTRRPPLDPEYDIRGRLLAALDRAIVTGHGGTPDLPLQVEWMRARQAGPDPHMAVQLCLEVMIERGTTARELERLAAVARDAGVNEQLYREEVDRRMDRLAAATTADADLHAALGIDPAWDAARVRAHLAQLYRTWNSRAESLADPGRRAEAERMLDAIARARAAVVDA